MKRRIFTTLDNLAKRDIFDAKYAQLEKEEKTLTSKSGARSEKRKSCLQKKTSSSLPPKRKSTQRSKQRKRHTTQSIFTLQAAMQKRVFGLAHDIQFSSFAQGENDQIRQIRR